MAESSEAKVKPTPWLNPGDVDSLAAMLPPEQEAQLERYGNVLRDIRDQRADLDELLKKDGVFDQEALALGQERQRRIEEFSRERARLDARNAQNKSARTAISVQIQELQAEIARLKLKINELEVEKSRLMPDYHDLASEKDGPLRNQRAWTQHVVSDMAEQYEDLNARREEARTKRGRTQGMYDQIRYSLNELVEGYELADRLPDDLREKLGLPPREPVDSDDA